jgi:TolB-like protein/Tfp pilus assembly protein PilF
LAALHIGLLGGFELRLASGEALPLKGRKTQALVAYLALSPGQRRSREELVALLWGERGEEQARSSLRQALSELRKALGEAGEPLLIADRESVTLDAGTVDVDVRAFERSVDEGTPKALERAAELYRGDFLDGFGVHDPVFEDWLRGERQRLHERACEALSGLLDHQAAGDSETAIATGRRLLALDPLREATHRALMRLYAGKGERALALKQYQACCDVLAAELDLSPEAETEALAEEIRGGGAGAGVGAAPEPAPGVEPTSPPGQPSIAVLPFTNMSGDPEQEYFSDGITENIIADLSRFRDLLVIARNSTFAYKGKAVKIQEVSQDLGARYILEGSVQRSNGRVRIIAQLIDGQTGGHLWVERYDRQLKDIFAVQDEVTEMIVGTLASGFGGRLRKAWQERAERKGPENAQAFDYFMRGMDMLNFNKEDTRRAGELFEEAIRLDPNYTKAYAKLAWVHIIDAVYGWSEDYESSMAKGLEFATMGVEKDDGESWAHWALAGYYMFMTRHDLAFSEFEKAMELNPNDAEVLTDVGMCLSYAGRAEEGLESAHKAMRINRHYPEWFLMQLGQIYYDARQYEDAVATFEGLRSLETTVTCLYLAASHAALGQSNKAKEAIARVLEFDPLATLGKWANVKLAPYADPNDLEHFRENLRKAGLPD